MGTHRRSVRRFWQLLVLAAALAACARGGGPAPVFDRANADRPVVRQAAATRPTSQIHIVRRGDTLHELGRAYAMPVRAIIDANRLRPPYTLFVGQRLALPTPRLHVVARGDTIYDVSRLYGVDMASLVRLNRVRPPYTIYVGQRLTLPAGARLPEVQLAARPAAAPAPAPVRVARVETTPAPPPQAVRPQTAGPQTTGPQTTGPRPKLKPVTPSRPAAAPAPAGPTVARGPIGRPPALNGNGLTWPVRGRILSRFGAKSDGLHNDGVNIAAPRGTPVVAAENGVVAYANSEINGLGNLLLIKHEGGLITAYAHNEALLVRRGDVVRKGQVVARVGTTGSVGTPQLHFEVRRGAEAVDPSGFLATG